MTPVEISGLATIARENVASAGDRDSYKDTNQGNRNEGTIKRKILYQ